MKKYTYSFLAAALACGMAQGAATAYTTPVGYTSLGNTAAGDNVPANTDVVVSIPLLKTAAYAGLVDSLVSSTKVKVKGSPAFGVDVWSATPHVLVIETGANSGMIVPIQSNTADELTVAPGVFNLTGIVADNKLSIRPAWTVKTFMAGASSLTGVRLLTYSNTQENINNSADGLYFYNSTTSSWENGDGDPADNDILYPGDGMVVRATSTAIADFVISGEVPTCKSYVAIGESLLANSLTPSGQRDTRFSYVSPVSETLAASGLGFKIGDVLLDFDNTSAGLNKSGIPYFFGAGGWENGDGDPAGTFELQSGKSYVYRSKPGAASGYIMAQDQQSYMPLNP